jgi:hypothetical protein
LFAFIGLIRHRLQSRFSFDASKRKNMRANSLLLVFVSVLLFKQADAQQKKENTRLGTIHHPALLEAVPAIPSSPQSAYAIFSRAAANDPDPLRLQPLRNKLERTGKEWKDFYDTKYSSAFQDAGGAEATRQKMEEEINSNALVSGMGGHDQMKNMSSSQAQAAAMNSASAYGAVNSMGLFTQEEIQRMMTDPQYAQEVSARRQNMSDAEKEAMVRNYANNHPVTYSSANEAKAANDQFSQQQAQANAQKLSMEIQSALSGITGELGEKERSFNEQWAQVKTESEAAHQKLYDQFNAEYNNIPDVIEANGRRKDPVKEKQLREKVAALHLERAASDLKARSMLYSGYESALKTSFAEYSSFLSKYKSRINDSWDGTGMNNTEIPAATVEMDLMGKIGNVLTSYSELAHDASSWYGKYVTAMK